MTVNGLQVRGGTLATVSHLAAARGHIHLLKKVLYRLNNMAIAWCRTISELPMRSFLDGIVCSHVGVSRSVNCTLNSSLVMA